MEDQKPRLKCPCRFVELVTKPSAADRSPPKTENYPVDTTNDVSAAQRVKSRSTQRVSMSSKTDLIVKSTTTYSITPLVQPAVRE